MKCAKCEGKGFVEFNSGLLQVGCADCSATGEVSEVKMELHEVITNREGNDNSSTRIRPDNSTTRGTDTGKPKRSQKSKTKKKA